VPHAVNLKNKKEKKMPTLDIIMVVFLFVVAFGGAWAFVKFNEEDEDR